MRIATPACLTRFTPFSGVTALRFGSNAHNLVSEAAFDYLKQLVPSPGHYISAYAPNVTGHVYHDPRGFIAIRTSTQDDGYEYIMSIGTGVDTDKPERTILEHPYRIRHFKQERCYYKNARKALYAYLSVAFGYPGVINKPQPKPDTPVTGVTVSLQKPAWGYVGLPEALITRALNFVMTGLSEKEQAFVKALIGLPQGDMAEQRFACNGTLMALLFLEGLSGQKLLEAYDNSALAQAKNPQDYFKTHLTGQLFSAEPHAREVKLREAIHALQTATHISTTLQSVKSKKALPLRLANPDDKEAVKAIMTQGLGAGAAKQLCPILEQMAKEKDARFIFGTLLQNEIDGRVLLTVLKTYYPMYNDPWRAFVEDLRQRPTALDSRRHRLPAWLKACGMQKATVTYPLRAN